MGFIGIGGVVVGLAPPLVCGRRPFFFGAALVFLFAELRWAIGVFFLGNRNGNALRELCFHRMAMAARKKITRKSTPKKALAKSRSMRDFPVTAEPSGGKPVAAGKQ